ncbi:MAG TPA: DUF305 domain-containing protein [Jatrophihabitans sp.]|nr:DUF305 domain-containing protein [Jatrophihabitans sp.]
MGEPDFPDPDDPDPDDPDDGGPVALRRALYAVILVAVLVVAATVGWLVRGGSTADTATASRPSAVDIGFARDMSTHHQQAVTMANYERDYTSSPQLRILAYDIETSQNFQMGEMQGWLDGWGLGRNSPNEMAWMGPGMGLGPTALMPGMATPAQLDRLESLHGKALDVLFLQLMIRHHQGGLPMARYAVEHARVPYVRNLAQAMINSQTAEIIEMEQLLRKLGGAPLPAPS